VYLLTITGHLAAVGFLVGSSGIMLSWHPWGVGAALAAGICMAFGLLCFFQALASGPATVVVPLTALYPLVTVILAWLILAEGLTLRHLAGIVLALAAVWLLSR
jgi:transporter family protein